MTTAIASHPVRSLFASARPTRVRTLREFAEAEIIMPPGGPLAGTRYRADYMAWQPLVLDLVESRQFRRVFASGPRQGGKTTLFYSLPILYYLFELRENVNVGVPDIAMAQQIYCEKILPVIARTRYRDLLPTSGAGSRGGRFRAVQMATGVWLRFMGAGGGSGQRTSHTARVVVFTELDKMDKAAKGSRETDPINEIEGTSAAFGSHALVWGECTMSTREGRVYQEVCEMGTDTRAWIPCPHCGKYILPVRGQFVGWQDARDMIEARERAGYSCQECGVVWTEADRLQAIRRPVLVHRGQTVNADGTVSGPVPRTNTLGFRWSQIHSPLVTMAEIAEREFRAERSASSEDKKVVLQYLWAEPYVDDDLTAIPEFKPEAVYAKIGRDPKGIIPDACDLLTAFLDLGKHWCWWSVWAWTPDAAGWCVDYGSIPVPQEGEEEKLAVRTAIRLWWFEQMADGYTYRDGRSLKIDLGLVDGGYLPEVAADFVSELGEGSWYVCRGQGTGRNQESWRSPAAKQGRLLGNNWYAERQPDGHVVIRFHDDHWKQEVHAGFRAPAGGAGSLHLYHAPQSMHRVFASHLTAEQQGEEFVKGRGLLRVWKRLHPRNHWLDCAKGCRLAADIRGRSPLRPAEPAPPPEQNPDADDSAVEIVSHSIRTQY